MKKLLTDLVPCLLLLLASSCEREDREIIYNSFYTFGSEIIELNNAYYAPFYGGDVYRFVLSPESVDGETISWSCEAMGIDNFLHFRVTPDLFGRKVAFDEAGDGEYIYVRINHDGRSYEGYSDRLRDVDGGTVEVTRMGEDEFAFSIHLIVGGRRVDCEYSGSFERKRYDPALGM